MNTANKITVARIALIPLFVLLLLALPAPQGPLWSAVVFGVASSTDRLDGVVARKFNMVTTFGKFLDPLADKLLMTAAIICLVRMHRCSAVLGVLILCRELVVTSFRIVAMGSGVVLAADGWGKAKTFAQNFAVIGVLIGMILPALAPYGTALLYVATALTLYSGWRYLYNNRACFGDDW